MVFQVLHEQTFFPVERLEQGVVDPVEFNPLRFLTF